MGLAGRQLYVASERAVAMVTLELPEVPKVAPPLPTLSAARRGFGPQPVGELAAFSTQPTFCDPKKPALPLIWEGVVGWRLNEVPERVEPSVTHGSIGEGLLDLHELRNGRLGLALNFAFPHLHDVRRVAPSGTERGPKPPEAVVRVELVTASGLTVFLSTRAMADAVYDTFVALRPKNWRAP